MNVISVVMNLVRSIWKATKPEQNNNWNPPAVEENANSIPAKDTKEMVDREASNGIPRYMYPVTGKPVVTSKYGPRELDYDNKKNPSYHYGIDLLGNDFNVRAPEDMIIKKYINPDPAYPAKFTKKSGSGYMKAIPPQGKTWEDKTWGWTPYVTAVGVYSKRLYVFRHVKCLVNVGTKIGVGEPFAVYGQYGFCLGAHLHFEVYPFVDPAVSGTNYPKTTDPAKAFGSFKILR